MIAQRSRGLLAGMVGCQASLAVILMAIAAEVTFSFFTSATPELWRRYPLYAVVVVIGILYEGLWRERWQMRATISQRGFLRQHQLTLRQTGFALGALLCFLALAKDQAISRTFLLLYLPLLYTGLLLSNLWLPRLLARHFFGGARAERILLLGSPQRARRLAGWLSGKEVLGFTTVGLLCEAGAAGEPGEIARLGGPWDLERVAREQRATQLLVLEFPEDRERHREIVLGAERLGLRVMIVSNLAEVLQHPVNYVEDDGVRFITLREEPLENPVNRLMKRSLDLAISAVVCAFVLPPVALVVWVLHRVQSPGPLFYTQVRAGIQNRQFRIVKFRTMHLNDEEARQAQVNDARVFPAGRWLRRLSIDELPQFLNVLRGEMSVTGPRPHLVEHNAQFAAQMANYHIRTFVKPGITGLAQVRGFRGEARSQAEIAARLASDISYLENWRLALDLSIIVRTAWQMVVPPRSAY